MNKRIALIMAVMLSCTGLISCDGGSDDNISSSKAKTVAVQTTKAKTTVSNNPVRKYSKTDAIDIAKKKVKEKYKDSSPVTLGDVKVTAENQKTRLDGTKYIDYTVLVKGHCWPKDSHGHSGKSKDFNECVHVSSDRG